LGILADVALFSSVSGGSITAGFIADRAVTAGVSDQAGWQNWITGLDYRQDLAEAFRKIVQTDLRTAPVLKHLLWNWAAPSARARSLEKLMSRHVSDLELGQLPVSPRFIFCATDLTHGINWEFRRHRAGSWRAGYLDARHWPLARAISTSACFPPVFGPVRISAAAADFRGGHMQLAGDPVRIQLTDGGVYDNLGLEPAWKFCRTVLVSDCGAPFTFSTGGHYLGRLLRYTSVIGNQALALRKRMLFGGLREGRFDGAYWGLSQSLAGEGYSADLVDDVICRIRTDLNRFTDAEFEVLVNHGYATTDRAIQRRAQNLVSEPAPLQAPYPELANEAAARRALKSSSKRISLRRALDRS
jgi:NTE family protein